MFGTHPASTDILLGVLILTTEFLQTLILPPKSACLIGFGDCAVIISMHDDKASFDLPFSPSSRGKKNKPQKTATATTTTKKKKTRNKQWILPNLLLWTVRFDSGILEVMVAPLIHVENLMWGNNLE